MNQMQSLPKIPGAAFGLARATCRIVFAASVPGFSHQQADTNLMFLDKISHAPESELPGLLYGYHDVPESAQKVLLGMLRPLRAPSPEQHLLIEATKQAGRFTMLIVHVPWPHGPGPGDLWPVVVTGPAGSEQVVGYVTPFNDIISLMHGSDRQDFGELAMWWITEYARRT
jgi:hypothetical protein